MDFGFTNQCGKDNWIGFNYGYNKTCDQWPESFATTYILKWTQTLEFSQTWHMYISPVLPTTCFYLPTYSRWSQMTGFTVFLYIQFKVLKPFKLSNFAKKLHISNQLNWNLHITELHNPFGVFFASCRVVFASCWCKLLKSWLQVGQPVVSHICLQLRLLRVVLM